MDVLRVLLCVGLGLLLWRWQIRGMRPIRDAFTWGVDHPFHFLLTAGLTLVIWGVVGAGFGLQGLFLGEDPLTQVLLGATVMMLIAAIIMHSVAIHTSRRGWWATLRSVAALLRGVNKVGNPARPVQGILANGLLDQLTPADIDSLERAARLSEGPDSGRALPAALRGELESEFFRILFAPAILLGKESGFVFLVGVVPALVMPLVAGDLPGWRERLPWLVGVCLGAVLSVILGCWTTAWIAAAAGWQERHEALLRALRRWAAELLPPDSAAAPAARAAVPVWYVLLACFFAIHAIVTLALPDFVTARWIDWPERTIVTTTAHGGPSVVERIRQAPWLPLGVIGGEAVAAALLVAGLARFPGLIWPDAMAALATRTRTMLGRGVGLVLHGLESVWLRRLALLAAVALAVLSLAITIGLAPESTRSVWLGLRGYASLGAVLVCWLGIFWLATHAAAGTGLRTPREQWAAVLGLATLGGLHLLETPAWITAPLAILAVAVSGSRTVAGLGPAAAAARLRPAFALGITAVGTATLIAASRLGAVAEATGVWLGLAVLVLGSTALSRVAAREPAMLYPATVLLGYAAFALPYAGLDERWQSAMPAAGSLACVVALVAAVYSLIRFLQPRGVLVTTLGLGALTLLLNGTALFIAPNEFKGGFPGMGPYYQLPVYLDSRDYFRETTPTTAKLRNRAVTEDFDRLAGQGASERLATVFFTMQPLQPTAAGGQTISLDVEDPRRRLRAVPGDGIRLAAEEWFTVRIDGDDCVALAEEPFYRRIFPWFRYELLHTIRDGIIRGPAIPLVDADAPPVLERPGVEPPTRYRFVRDGDPADKEVELGLRLEGLAAVYRKADADYALIAFNWTGRVTSVRHDSGRDVYRVVFEIPAGSSPLDAAQLQTMASWMERCHLDTLRPSQSITAVAADRLAGPVAAAAAGAGDCLVLDDVRAEAAVPAGVFLARAADPAGYDPAFRPFWPTMSSMRRAIDAARGPTPPPTAADPAVPAGFLLRPALDRGVFASLDAEVAQADGARVGPSQGVTVGLYNAGRLRAGDRLMLTWQRRGDPAAGAEHARGAVFDLVSLRAAVAGDKAAACPPGIAWATLRPVEAGAGDELGPPGPIVGQWQTVEVLNNSEVLQAWRDLVGPRWEGKKPKLVIVTVSGGGIRASVWTAVVLRKLEATLGSDFPYHIRLITGASGGMVAASYYATSLAPPRPGVLAGGTASFADQHGTGIEEFVDRLAIDQLDAVAGQMIFSDLPGSLSPFGRSRDRGRTLEQTWIRWTGGNASPLGRPLQSYADDERLGWRPSLVFTPMMVEDGRRLLISNLDLAFATRNVGGLLIEPSSRKIERPTIQGGDFDSSIHEEDDVFSLSAVEFFRLFPQARDFQVATAVRMSASFPWVAPVVHLPTLPPRRVVDAGYYDNYGVNLSALWLSKMSDWLQANTSGVLVVQVRDKVSQGARTEIDFDRAAAGNSLLDRLVWHGGSKLLRPGLKALSTPLIGVANARQWTMAFRNDEQVDLQDLLFDTQRGRDFFRTVVFECPVDVSLNWTLTTREKAVLAGGFGRPAAAPREELSRVADYMTGRESYEFHKWKIDHRNDASFHRDLKERYDVQLRALGVTGTDRLTAAESRSLYENVVQNLKRLELLADWWNEGRVAAAP